MTALLGGRGLQEVRRALTDRHQHKGLARATRVYGDPARTLWRYVSARGDYPARCRLRTPLGPVAPLLHSHHDLLTVHEVFCRLDYGTPPDGSVIVDFGANIGLSALFFLTRGAAVRCHAVEPVPTNVARLRETLAAFEDRYTVVEAAVERFDGPATFNVDETGRYGGLGMNRTPERITVQCAEVNGLLERVLEREGRIDLLKVDVEHSVVPVVRAIRDDVLADVREIVLEAEFFPYDLTGFRRRSDGIIHRFTRG